MTTMELNAKLLRELSYIASNEELLKKALKYITRLKKSAETQTEPYTVEELHQRIAESEADEAAGRDYTSQEVFGRMEKKFPWLCK